MKVRTVLGDVEPSALGVTYMHEHLIIDSPIVAAEFEHIHLPSVDDAIAETQLCAKLGVGAFLDCMPMGSGRDVRKLAQISQATKLHIISATGLHRSKYYSENDPIESMSEDQLAKAFIDEVLIGMEGTDHRAGVIKVVSGGKEISTRDELLIRAAVSAHTVTGAPILSHTEHGVGAIEQIHLFKKLGQDLSKVVISHTDKETNLDYHREILDSGVNVEYDQSLRELNNPESPSAQITAAMVQAGYGEQIMLGTDGARRSLWSSLGGTPGLSALYSSWGKRLIEKGISQEDLNTLFITNPARFLAFKVAS